MAFVSEAGRGSAVDVAVVVICDNAFVSFRVQQTDTVWKKYNLLVLQLMNGGAG